MLRPITLERLAPVGDDAPADCVVVYPGETTGSVILVSYDGAGAPCEQLSRRALRVTRDLIGAMLMRLP